MLGRHIKNVCKQQLSYSSGAGLFNHPHCLVCYDQLKLTCPLPDSLTSLVYLLSQLLSHSLFLYPVCKLLEHTARKDSDDSTAAARKTSSSDLFVKEPKGLCGREDMSSSSSLRSSSRIPLTNAVSILNFSWSCSCRLWECRWKIVIRQSKRRKLKGRNCEFGQCKWLERIYKLIARRIISHSISDVFAIIIFQIFSLINTSASILRRHLKKYKQCQWIKKCFANKRMHEMKWRKDYFR